MEENKQILCLIGVVFFSYHGLSDTEAQKLKAFAQAHQANQELDWAYHFVKQDTSSASQRALVLLRKMGNALDAPQLLNHLHTIYTMGQYKDYLTAAEAHFLRRLAHLWKLQAPWIETLIQK